MALLKSFEVENSGINADYIRVSNVSVIRIGNSDRLVITCQLYKDQASRDAGKDPISTMSYTVDDQVTLDNISTDMYNILKTLPDFTGAADV